jgi:hypothetical protein
LKRADEKLDFRWGATGPLPTERRPTDLKLTLDLPRGNYRAEWVDPVTGTVVAGEDVAHAGGDRALVVPKFEDDLALRLKAK